MYEVPWSVWKAQVVKAIGPYHVELPGQISERSSSIVFFIKELKNIKK
jgi:hypothetical protein